MLLLPQPPQASPPSQGLNGLLASCTFIAAGWDGSSVLQAESSPTTELAFSLSRDDLQLSAVVLRSWNKQTTENGDMCVFLLF